jgi:hemerythrin-like metal-binding protein
MNLQVCRGWDEQYLVGDTLVDGEHKRIIEKTCSFARVVEVGAISYREALDMAREVLFHINTHFQHEELLLELYNADSADIELHKKEHAKLRVMFLAAVEEIREQEDFRKACIIMVNDLYELIANHIATVDKETLSPCITTHDKFHHQYAY